MTGAPAGVTPKIWGETVCFEWNPFMSLHRAEVRGGYRCSKHYHANKWNGFFVESGWLSVRIYNADGSETVHELTPGRRQYLAVPPGVKHRFESASDTVLFEIYWPAEQTEDIIRDDEGGCL